jgi:large subunit ribosomal protein L9
MKVILQQDIRGTGKKDQVIEVSDGYGRNYLLPRKLAREATSDALNAITNSQSAQKHRDEVKKLEAEAKAKELKGKIVNLTAKGGANGKLYGAVTNDAIAQALKEQYGIEVDKRKLEPEEPVRSAGQTLCNVRISAGVSTRMILNVTVEEK